MYLDSIDLVYRRQKFHHWTYHGKSSFNQIDFQSTLIHLVWLLRPLSPNSLCLQNVWRFGRIKMTCKRPLALIQEGVQRTM